jgi:molybdate transport system substrate-binding protein
VQQVIRGEAFDVSIVTPPYPEVLASGNVVASSATPLASVAIGVAVRKGAPKPDISTPQAVKRMLLAAKSIAYPDAAQSLAGVRVEEALKKLGITGQMEPKTKRSRGGSGVMAMVAKGEADIGMAVLSEMTNPDVDVIGTLPQKIAALTSFVGFVSAHAKDPAAAKALLDYLSSPDAAAAYKAHGMQPVH